jgi:hypothetical protein
LASSCGDFSHQTEALLGKRQNSLQHLGKDTLFVGNLIVKSKKYSILAGEYTRYDMRRLFWWGILLLGL